MVTLNRCSAKGRYELRVRCSRMYNNNGTRLRAFATFLPVPINFHSARSFFFLLSHDRDKLFNGEKRWRHFRAQQSWNRYHSLVQRARAMLFFFPPSRRQASLRKKRVFLARLPPTLFMIPAAISPSHVTALAAILRIATSRKRILRPQLRVQAILLLNILRAWEPCTRRPSVNKMIFSASSEPHLHAPHAYI